MSYFYRMQSNVLLNVLPKTVLRYSWRTYVKNKKRNSYPKQIRQNLAQNPGVQKRMNILYKERDASENIDVDDVDDYETDFMSVGQVHKINKHEMEDFKEKEKLRIVGRKYFKEEKINFLTWEDKEQIRHLHQTNPEEWTVEKLSDGFPALPNTIVKIINATWKASSQDRKKNHDKHVENNWKLLKEGKLTDLHPELLHHIMKFTKRKLNLSIDEKVIIRQNNINDKPGEYASIIENYNKLVNEKNNKYEKIQEDAESNVLTNISVKQEFQTKEEKKDRRVLTLTALKKDIENKMDKNQEVSQYEKMIVRNTEMIVRDTEDIVSDKEEKSITTDAVKIGGMQTYKVESNKSLTNMDKKVIDALTYPERIIIPKGKYKRGSTYKINDCYYDYDGEFLYRVPGLD